MGAKSCLKKGDAVKHKIVRFSEHDQIKASDKGAYIVYVYNSDSMHGNDKVCIPTSSHQGYPVFNCLKC